MEILLKTTVEHLGQVGEVVRVKDGYARNYLLPLGYGIPITKANLALIERERAKIAAEEQKRVQALRDLSAKLQSMSVTIEGKANEQGHLFGSVSAAQISRALIEKGFHVEERQVRLESPLKEIGVFDVKLHLHAEVESTVKVWVVQAKPN